MYSEQDGSPHLRSTGSQPRHSGCRRGGGRGEDTNEASQGVRERSRAYKLY